MLVVAGCGDKEEEEPIDQQEDDDKDVEEVEQEDDEEKEGAAKSEPGEIDEQYAEEALAVLEENNKYANAQDVDGYLKAVPEEMKDQNRQIMEETFAQGKIDFEIVDYQFESANEKEVVISVLQTTVAAEPIEGFNDNISELQHVLRKEDGEWKIFQSDIINSEPYGEDGEVAEDINEESAEAALDVLYDNIDYANDQDVDGYLKAIPEQEQETARKTIEEMFAEGKLEFEIVEHVVVSADENTVEIGVVQTTVAVDDIDGFEDNITEILHTLVLEDDEWKIDQSDILAAEPLDE